MQPYPYYVWDGCFIVLKFQLLFYLCRICDEICKLCILFNFYLLPHDAELNKISDSLCSIMSSGFLKLGTKEEKFIPGTQKKKRFLNTFPDSVCPEKVISVLGQSRGVTEKVGIVKYNTFGWSFSQKYCYFFKTFYKVFFELTIPTL